MVYEVKQDEATQEQWEEMKKIVQDNLCWCGGELQIHTTERGTLEVWCPHNPNHHGYIERQSYTQAFRRGEGAPLVIKDKIEKKMLPGGYPLGTALALIKARFPRADLDDPSAALFVMDCIRLDLDPLLGEIVPVTFKSTDKATGEVRKVVTPILTEDGWLSLAARACPDRWVGPPITEPISDKEFKKELCDEEVAWVWKATGRTKDGTESVAYGWLKQKEYKRAREPGKETPAGDLPGNQARVRAIKRWVRETFPEAKARMKEMTSEWLTRGKDIEEVQQVIEAEYHIVTETPTSKGGEKIGSAAEEQPGGEGKPSKTILSSPKQETTKATPPAEPVDEQEGFSIDPTWLKESLNQITWSEETARSWIITHFKLKEAKGTLTEVISGLTREQAEEFVKEIQDRVAQKQIELF